MGAAGGLSLRSPGWDVYPCLVMLLGLVFLWAGCGTSDHQMLTTPTAASPLLEQQAIANLFDLYRQALLQEDIDRLQALLAAETPSAQPGTPLQQAAPRHKKTVPDTFFFARILWRGTSYSAGALKVGSLGRHE